MVVFIPLLSDPLLPSGYKTRLFTEGDETHWARIETSVLEFDSANQVYDYFVKLTFLIDDLKSRCIFVLNPIGLPIATATAWYDNGHTIRQAFTGLLFLLNVKV